jgi:hypothetical protein
MDDGGGDEDLARTWVRSELIEVVFWSFFSDGPSAEWACVQLESEWRPAGTAGSLLAVLGVTSF